MPPRAHPRSSRPVRGAAHPTCAPAALFVAVLAACSGGATGGRGRACVRDADCESGSLCAAGACAPSAAERLAVLGPAILRLGGCGAFSAVALAEDGPPAAVGADATVVLSGPAAGRFYLDGECTVATETVVIARGAALGLFWFAASAPERFILKAEAVGLGVARVPVVVQAEPGPAAAIRIDGPSSVTPSSCAPFTVTAVDADGGAAVVGADTKVSLSGGGSGSFYGDAACTAAADGVTLAAATSSATFYFTDAAAEGVILTADAVQLGVARHAIVVAAGGGPAAGLTWTGPRVISQGACVPFAVATVDAAGGAVTTPAGAEVSLSGGGAGAYYRDSGCTQAASAVTIAAGGSLAVAYFRDLRPQVVLLEASAPGLASASARVVVLSSGKYPTHLGLGGPARVRAGQCAAYAVTSTDALGAPVPVLADEPVALGGAGGGGFYLDAGCFTPITAVALRARKSSATFFFRGKDAEALVLTAADGGPAGLAPASLAVAVEAGAPAQVVLGGPARVAAGDCTAYAVTTFDAEGVVASVPNATTVDLSGAGAGGLFFDPACLFPAASVIVVEDSAAQTFYFADATAETVTLAADTSVYGGDTLEVEVTPGAPEQLTLDGPATIFTGACSGPYVVATLDGEGNATTVSALTPIALGEAGQGAFYSDDLCTTEVAQAPIAAGTGAQSVWLRDPVAESLVLGATDPAGALAGATLQVAVEAAPLTSAQVTLGSTFPGFGGEVTIAFTTASDWPADGSLAVTFPEGFYVGDATFVSAQRADGDFTVSVDGQTVTIKRSNGTAVEAGTAVEIVLGGIVNPGSAGTTGAYALSTVTSTGETIDAAEVGGATLAYQVPGGSCAAGEPCGACDERGGCDNVACEDGICKVGPGGACTSETPCIGDYQCIWGACVPPRPSHACSRWLGGPGIQSPGLVAFDRSDGSTVVAGVYSQGTIDLGGGAFTNAAYEGDVFVAKYGPDCAHLWSKSFGGTSYDEPGGLGVDGSGNVYLAGRTFSPSISFGGPALAKVGNLHSAFIAKLNSNGEHVWSNRFRDSPAKGIAVNAAGDIAWGGEAWSGLDLGAPCPVLPSDTPRRWVARMGPDGACRWIADLGTIDPSAFAIDEDGTVAVAANFSGITLTIDGRTIIAGDNTRGLIALLEAADGSIRWARTFGGSNVITPSGTFGSAAYPRGIAFGLGGDVFLTGAFLGDGYFWSQRLPCACGDANGFLGRYAGADGELVWLRSLGHARGNGLAVDQHGNPIVTGLFFGTVAFDGVDFPGGAYDAFVAKFAASYGQNLWFWSAWDSEYTGSEGSSVAADGAGRLALAGTFGGSVDVALDLGGGPLAGEDQWEAFLAWLDDLDCVPETDAELCARLAIDCGSTVATDACGNPRTLSCGTGCSPSLSVQAHIDGTGRLVVHRSTVQWRHGTDPGAAPGRLSGGTPDQPRPTRLNGIEWWPTWPDRPNAENLACNCDSSKYVGTPELPAMEQTVSLGVSQGRGSVAIVQQPSAANDYTLIVEFNDPATSADPTTDADWYSVFLSWSVNP